MVSALEDAILAKLASLRESLPRLELRSYGGELDDGDLLAQTLAAGHAVLVTVPKAKFTRRGTSGRTFDLAATVRLVICARQARSETATRRGTAGSAGTYSLWESCMRLLTGYIPVPGATALTPADFQNLVNGRDQRDYLSVIGQSFEVRAIWTVPEDAQAPITGIDLNYYLNPDDGLVDATDRVPDEETP